MSHKILEHSNNSANNTTTKTDPYDVVDFYLQPEFIKILTQQIAEQPKVDLEKVAQIKQALNNKSLVLDDLSLAEKIINFETQLFKPNKN